MNAFQLVSTVETNYALTHCISKQSNYKKTFDLVCHETDPYDCRSYRTFLIFSVFVRLILKFRKLTVDSRSDAIPKFKTLGAYG